ARASGWRLQHQDTGSLAHAAAPLPRPRAEAYDRNLKARDWDRNYVHSLQWLWLTEPLSEGPGESWISPTVDLVKGESMTRLQRLFAVADCANGIGSKLDITKWTFVNTDLAVHVFRVPDGDWIGIRAETSYGPDGIGTTIGTLFDEQGAVGAIQQSVLVRRRPGRA
ncbi:thioesterase, partial [Mycobacterium avium 09-5983]